MSNWLYHFSARTHVLLLPFIFIAISLVASTLAALTSSGDMVRQELPYAHFVGTSLLFILLPAYSMVMLFFLWQSTERLTKELSGFAPPDSVDKVRQSASRFQGWRWIVIGAGIVFGLSQNEHFVRQMITTGRFTAIDIVFVLQSAILWLFISEVIAWRITVSRALADFARRLTIDILETDKFKPVVRTAATDILVVAGAMAFMPLQSLDAAFRIGNYLAGAVIGVIAALAMFAIPVMGVRRNILMTRQQRLKELVAARPTAAETSIESLELHLAHEDRIRSISGWPIDLQLAARIVGYTIIPPIAWVGAALVEQLIE